MHKNKKDLKGVTWTVNDSSYEVVSEAEARVSPSGGKVTMWRVQHKNCGSIFLASAEGIVKHKQLVCSVCQIIPVGKRFMHLVVIGGPEKRRGLRTTKLSLRYPCKCSCNTVVWVLASSLKSGRTTHCGCQNKNKHSSNFKDISGSIFGRLVVLNYSHTEHKRTYFTCYCDPALGGCGTICTKYKQSLLQGLTTSCGCYLIETHSGANNAAWKGGVTRIQDSIRTCVKYKLWRDTIYERDNYKCQVTDLNTQDLQAHHIKPFHVILEENNITTIEEACSCEELWNVNNGITISENWHTRTSSNPLALHTVLGFNYTKQQFEDWLSAVNQERK